MTIEIKERLIAPVAKAPAKINLFFEILGKRDDGYHEIETLVAPVDWCDQLEFYSREPLSENDPGVILECYDEYGRKSATLSSDSSNLVVRAYNAYYREASALNRPVSRITTLVKLFKKIPIKSGLGGGSSDASTALSVLNGLSDSLFAHDELKLIAGKIGSDIPLFLEKGASIGRGRGEIVRPYELPSFPVLIVKPKRGVSTLDAFRRVDETASLSSRRSLDALVRDLDALRVGASPDDRDARIVRFLAERMANRLEDAVLPSWKEARALRDALTNVDGSLGAQMTGSGSAFFAIFPSLVDAQKALDLLLSRDSVSRVVPIETACVVQSIR